jgi:hypothetical protein
MATVYWIGQAPAVAQVATAQVTAYDASTTYALTIGGVSVSTVGVTDAAGTATALAAAWNASADAYFTGITASAATDTVTMTADVAGVPFTVTSSDTGGTGTIGAVSVTTAASGPNDWSVAANWSGGAVPVNDDDVIISSGPNICWGLAQSSVSLDSLTVLKSYTGRIGLDPDALATNSAGTATTAGKREYRAAYLAIHADTVDLGVATFGNPAGSGRINIDTGSTAATITVHDTAAAVVVGQGAVNIKAASASTDVIVRRATTSGGVGIAALVPGETSTIRTLDVSPDGTPRVNVGSGTTATNIFARGGNVSASLAATLTKLEVSGGSCTLEGTALVTTANVQGGVLYPYNDPASGAAIATLNAYAGQVLGIGGSPRTWTTVNVFRGAEVRYDSDTVTLTNVPVGNLSIQGA